MVGLSPLTDDVAVYLCIDGWRALDLYQMYVHVAPHRLHPDPARGGKAVDARHGGLERGRQGNVAATARIELCIEASKGWRVEGRPMVLAGAIILSHEGQHRDQLLPEFYYQQHQ
jgi:hypothetical protein